MPSRPNQFMGKAPVAGGVRTTFRGAILQRVAGLVSRPARPRAQRRYSLCIFKPDRIGDFVLALGAIRLLLNHFGVGNCVLVISPFARELAEMEFPETPQIVVPPFVLSLQPRAIWAELKLRHRLGAAFFQNLACLRHQRFRSQNLMLYWVRAAQRYGLENQQGYYLGAECEFRFTNRDNYPEEATAGSCLELESHRKVLERLLTQEIPIAAVLPSFRSITSHPGRNLLVCPFTSSALKDLPETVLVEVLVALQARYCFPIQLSYAPDQLRRGQVLEATLRQRGLVLLPFTPSSLREYVVAVSRAHAVLTTDTATAHIATALDIPTVVVLGGGHYGQYGPWQKSDRQVWLANRLPCFHCNWVCSQPEPYCITHIKPDDIVAAMVRVLGNAQS